MRLSQLPITCQWIPSCKAEGGKRKVARESGDRKIRNQEHATWNQESHRLYKVQQISFGVGSARTFTFLRNSTMHTLTPFFIALLLSLSSLTSAEAQWSGHQLDPAEIAAQQTRLMTDSLHLSTAQVERVSEVNTRYALKQQELRDNSDGDFKSLRESMGALVREQNVELKKYLTGEQWTTWQRIREEQRKSRPPHTGRRQ